MATYFDSGQHHFGVFVECQRLFWFIVAVLGFTAQEKWGENDASIKQEVNNFAFLTCQSRCWEIREELRWSAQEWFQTLGGQQKLRILVILNELLMRHLNLKRYEICISGFAINYNKETKKNKKKNLIISFFVLWRTKNINLIVCDLNCRWTVEMRERKGSWGQRHWQRLAKF